MLPFNVEPAKVRARFQQVLRLQLAVDDAQLDLIKKSFKPPALNLTANNCGKLSIYYPVPGLKLMTS